MREEIERVEFEATQLPSSDLLETEFQSLQEKVQGFSDSLSIFSTTCDRLAFDLEQGQQVQQQEQHAFMSTVTGFLENLERQSTESAAQNRTAIDQLRSETKDGLGGLLQLINNNINPANQRPEGFLPDTPLQERNPAAKDPEAIKALSFAQQFFMVNAESIESQIISQFDISAIDPTTFTRHRNRFADVKAFTEAVAKEDASVEKDLKDALEKQGQQKISALHALREKLGHGSHRQQQLGDAMLLHLLSRSTTSTVVKDSVKATCHDFVLLGRFELQEFMVRCTKGESILPSDTDTTQRHEDTAEGLLLLNQPEFTAALMAGIVLKLGYSDKPTGDLNALLRDFHNTKQKPGEKAHNYINRILVTETALQDTTQIMQMQDHMPTKGQILTQLEKGATAVLRTKAYEIIQIIYRMPLRMVKFNDMASALREAESQINEAADKTKAFNTHSPPPPAEKTAGEDNHKKSLYEELKDKQDPALTLMLKEKKVCLSHVAGTVGKSTRHCIKGDACEYQHVLPSEVGLVDDDYKKFVVVIDHLRAPTPPTMFNGRLPPHNPKVALPAIQEGTDDSSAEDKENKKDDTAPAPAPAICSAVMSAPLIDRNNLSIMPGSLRGRTAI